MTTMNISLPSTQKEFVDKVIKEGQFSTASEYIRKLIREDYERRENEENKWLLKIAKEAEMEGGETYEFTDAFLEEIRQEALAAFRNKKASASTRART